jgi:hypothetical protein
MNILHYQMQDQALNQAGHLQSNDRFQRNPKDDLKEGLDLIFELKEKLDKLHPIATEMLLQMISR